MKKVNSAVKVLRWFIDTTTGKKELRPTIKDISQCDKKDIGKSWCPECDEEVSLHLTAKPPHYEHRNRAGKLCSFKTKP